MVSRIVHNTKKPGPQLAEKIAHTLTANVVEREGIAFFLLGCHKHVDELMEKFPHAFEDFRTARDRKDDEGLRIY